MGKGVWGPCLVGSVGKTRPGVCQDMDILIVRWESGRAWAEGMERETEAWILGLELQAVSSHE